VYLYNSNKTKAKKLEISTKSMFTATEGPTDMPHVVLGYSVGVVGQYHAIHNHQSTKDILGTLK
jgi:hypothetical protein